MKVRELLSSKRRWTQGAAARNRSGDALDLPDWSKARSWCLWGAIRVCYLLSPGNLLTYDQVMACVRNAIAGEDVMVWNDGTSRDFAEVRAMIEELDI